MCGIAGIKKIDTPDDPGTILHALKSMADSLQHRGPDAEGFYQINGLGLAHRRLSIIDITGGAQPMTTVDGDLSVTFNGEIFNFLELRAGLKAKGYEFRTQSDTEVILHLYRECGKDFVSQLNGQFAIALWDNRQQQLLLIRDRVGICPLFYTQFNTTLAFASEIKALAAVMPGKLNIKPQAVDDIFTGWACVEPDTIFENIYQVCPGSMLIIDSHNRIQNLEYWSLDYPTDQDDYDQRSESALIDELHEQLRTATRLRLRADVPVGAYLSGGLDSSLLVALMARDIPHNLQTFSLRFTNPDIDERRFQTQVIDHLNTQHQHLEINDQDVAVHLVKTIYHTESPVLRTAPVPMGLLSAFTHQAGHRVVLTGEGADEILGGYDIFKEAKVRRFWAQSPNSKWRHLLLQRLYPYMKLPKTNTDIYLKRFFGAGLDTPELLWHSHLPRWASTSKAKLFFSEELQNQLSEQYEDRIHRLFPSSATQWRAFNRAQYLETKTLMSGYLLNSQGDRMLTMNSVEGRFPYLDHNLIAFARRLPPKFKMKALQEKYLLRKVAKRYLPEKISSRFKQPYRSMDAATNQGFLLNEELSEYMTHGAINKAGLFDFKKVDFLIKKVRGGKLLNTSESQALTGMLTTQILHKHYC